MLHSGCADKLPLVAPSGRFFHPHVDGLVGALRILGALGRGAVMPVPLIAGNRRLADARPARQFSPGERGYLTDQASPWPSAASLGASVTPSNGPVVAIVAFSSADLRLGVGG